MKRELLNIYVCPLTHSPLTDSKLGSPESSELNEGELISAGARHYCVRQGIPVFIPSEMLTVMEQATQAEYDASADQKYDDAVDWQFRSFLENEDDVREGMVDLLLLKPDARVLEIGCGTGRDSFRIARRLDRRGQFFVQDLSERMVFKTRERLGKFGSSPRIEYFVSTARFLPFPDGFFDAVFHFGGFNNFSEPKKTLAEMTRVVKKNGCVVFGDEALAPCLDGTEFGEMMVTNNPLFKNKVPLECLPEGARNVTLRWILGSCFYLINFKAGVGPPPVDMDLPHKGWRGGTMRTRYYGRLEGVTPEARKMAIEAAKARGVSVHEWLDTLVRKAAKSNLERSSEGGAENLTQ